MKKLLMLLTLITAPMLHAQSIPCPAQPTLAYVKESDTTVSVNRSYSVKGIVCRGIASRVLSGKTVVYQVQFPPCGTDTLWRIYSAVNNGIPTNYSTAASALSRAAKTPACPVVPPVIVLPPPVITPPPDIPIPPVVTPPSTLTWTQCAVITGMCEATGAHMVRMVSATDTLTSFMYNSLPCYVNHYAGFWPTTSRATFTRCDMSPKLVDTVPNLMPMHPTQPSVWIVARGDVGSIIMDTSSRQGAHYNDGTLNADGTKKETVYNEGDFRTVCFHSKTAILDPIAFPGQVTAGHPHDFFGNVDVTGSFVQDSTVQHASTCSGGLANQTAYWAPSMYDTVTKQLITPQRSTFYYKSSYRDGAMVMNPMPFGLKIIAGNKLATSHQHDNATASWYCPANGNGDTDGSIRSVASCPAGGVLQLTVKFPSCWDGVHLDSPNHQSHMAYITYQWYFDSNGQPAQRQFCPDGWKLVPQISELIQYPIGPTDDYRNWRLVSDGPNQLGGQSAHSDWYGGMTKTMRDLTKQCLAAAIDCGVNDTGPDSTGKSILLEYHPNWKR